MSEIKVHYQPEHDNVSLVSLLNGHEYLILIKMHKRIRWEVDYVFEAGAIPEITSRTPSGHIHVRALIDNNEVQLSYMIERGMPQDVCDLLEKQTNMLVRKMKKNLMFL